MNRDYGPWNSGLKVQVMNKGNAKNRMILHLTSKLFHQFMFQYKPKDNKQRYENCVDVPHMQTVL
jgi:hypothetical protein